MSSAPSAADTTPSDRSGNVLVTSAVFLAIATVFVFLRCVSKFGIRRRADVDDLVTILAWLFTVALSISIIFGATVGVGKVDAIIRPEWRAPLKKAVYVFPIFYHLSSMTAKTACLLLYIRMARAHTLLRYASMAVLAVVDIAGIVLVFLNIFQCRPITAAWHVDQGGKCFDLVTLFLASAPINILSDLAILILPLPIITELRMERRAKLGLVLTFMCGVFVAAVDVVRIAYLQTALKEQIHMGSSTVTASTVQPNYYWYTAWGLMWSAIECSVRVACCSALVLKPLIQRFKPSSLTSRGRSNENSRSRRSAGGSFPGELTGYSDNGTIPLSPPGSPRSKNMPLQAILETAPDVPESDQMDIYSFFAAGPPGMSALGVGAAPGSLAGLGRQLSPVDGSASTSETMRGSQPLTKQRTCQSEPHHHRLSMLSAPIRWMTRESVPPDQSQQPVGNFFDFVQMGGRKPLTELTAKEAWWPVMFVSILFFLWGFSYGLLGNLNNEILNVIGKTPGRSLMLTSAYWLGYIIGPPTFGAYILPRYGFKSTFMSGLVIYGCGTMCFWPSSVLASFGGFIFSNILIAVGLSILEAAANPYIALAGPGYLSEARLNFSQGIQALGGLFSPILAQKALFNNVTHEGRVSLFDVQWCYLAVSLFVLFLALVFFYVPLSEASDDELQAETDQRLKNAGVEPDARAYGMPARWFVIGMGVFTMVCYVGQQESFSYYWTPYTSLVLPNTDPFWDLSIGHGLFAAGRFIAAGICYMGFTPRLVLNVCCAGTFITTLLAVVLPASKGAFACVLLAMFFESPVFPTLYAVAVRGQGRHTKWASIALTIAVGGTVIWQSATFGVYENSGNDVRKAFIIIVVLCGVQSIYPAMLAARPVLRRYVDPRWSRGGERRVSAETFGSVEKGPVHDDGMPEINGRREEKNSITGAFASMSMMPTMATMAPPHVREEEQGRDSGTGMGAGAGAGTGTGAEAGTRTPRTPGPGTPHTPGTPTGGPTHVVPDLPVVGMGQAPVIPRAEGDGDGPTEGFAGYGVVGDLPDIEL